MEVLLRRKKFYVLYPEYFDSKISRSQGRRVSMELADPEPHIKKLSKACEKLNLEYQSQPEKAHPKFWWKKSGRILIPIDKKNKKAKEELIKEIAAISRKFIIKKKKKKIKKKSAVKISSGQGKTIGSKKTTKHPVSRNVSAKRKKKVKK